MSNVSCVNSEDGTGGGDVPGEFMLGLGDFREFELVSLSIYRLQQGASP
jgi:hypothetical protein